MLTKNQLLTPASPAIAASELANFLGLPSDAGQDALLNLLLDSASGVFTRTTNRAAGIATYAAHYDTRPQPHRRYFGVAPMQHLATSVALPLSPVLSVVSVTDQAGNPIDYAADLGRTRATVDPGTSGQFVVEYTAGYDELPATARLGILMLAAYLYEHRGQCDVTQAAAKSGARDTWAGLVVYGGGL